MLQTLEVRTARNDKTVWYELAGHYGEHTCRKAWNQVAANLLTNRVSGITAGAADGHVAHLLVQARSVELRRVPSTVSAS